MPVLVVPSPSVNCVGCLTEDGRLRGCSLRGLFLLSDTFFPSHFALGLASPSLALSLSRSPSAPHPNLIHEQQPSTRHTQQGNKDATGAPAAAEDGGGDKPDSTAVSAAENAASSSPESSSKQVPTASAPPPPSIPSAGTAGTAAARAAPTTAATAPEDTSNAAAATVAAPAAVASSATAAAAAAQHDGVDTVLLDALGNARGEIVFRANSILILHMFELHLAPFQCTTCNDTFFCPWHRF